MSIRRVDPQSRDAEAHVPVPAGPLARSLTSSLAATLRVV